MRSGVLSPGKPQCPMANGPRSPWTIVSFHYNLTVALRHSRYPNVAAADEIPLGIFYKGLRDKVDIVGHNGESSIIILQPEIDSRKLLQFCRNRYGMPVLDHFGKQRRRFRL